MGGAEVGQESVQSRIQLETGHRTEDTEGTEDTGL
jgi:hypothetical protein